MTWILRNIRVFVSHYIPHRRDAFFSWPQSQQQGFSYHDGALAVYETSHILMSQLPSPPEMLSLRDEGQ